MIIRGDERMQSEVDDTKIEEDAVTENETDVPEGTVVMSEDSFDDGDISMEVNVEGLVKEFENKQVDDVERKKEVRRKLEELVEENSFEDTYAVEFEDN
jgi:hypothetical protein